jgi:hypothetical protein
VHGVTYIDISEIETRGPAYCIMSTEGYAPEAIFTLQEYFPSQSLILGARSRYPVHMVRYRPYTIDDYLIAYGEDTKLDTETVHMDHYSLAFNKLANYNRRRPGRLYAESTQLDIRLLQRSDLEPIWSDMPEEEVPEQDEDDDDRNIKNLPDRRVEPEDGNARVSSLVDLSLEVLRKHLISDQKAAKMAVQLPPTLHSYLWRKLCITKRSKITDHLVPLSFAQLGAIQKLDLTFCSSLTDAALNAVAADDSTKFLRAFHVSDNQFITSQGLNMLSEKLHHLVDLRAHRCSSVRSADLSPDTKTIMAFSYDMKGCGMDIYIVLGAGDRLGSNPTELIRVMRHDWLYGLAALRYLLRAIDHPTPTWMDFGTGGYNALPFGSSNPELDTVLNNVQTTVDHFPGFYTLDAEKGIFGDVWELRHRLLTRPGGQNVRLRRDADGGPPSGAAVIDLRERDKIGIKYCFMATKDSFLGVCPDVTTMVPLSAQEYAAKFYPSEEPNRTLWTGSRSTEAIQHIEESVAQLATKLSSFPVMSLQDLRSISYTGAFFAP